MRPEAFGTLRDAYGAVDWAATPLGPIDAWTPALQHTLDMALASRFPITLLWGPELVLVYNEAYVQLIADKHPAALGRPAREIFPEAWDLVGPLLDGVLSGGDAVWLEDQPVPLWRRGHLEECYFTFSYSPVRGAGGGVEGVVDISAETTRQVVDRRRLVLLDQLRQRLAGLDRARDVPSRALPVLTSATDDLAAVQLQLGDEVFGDARLPLRPGIGRALDVVVEDRPDGPIAWLALRPSQPGVSAGTLTCRLSPRVRVDGACESFLRLIASSLSQALDRLAARDAERDAATVEREMSAALQRSLLSQPPRLPGVDIAVRYLPAAQQAQVGGDWYDAFVRADGTLTFAIGDVAGHDRFAAAGMAEIRSLLRGIAFATDGAPAAVLASLDAALVGLEIETFASAVVGELVPGSHELVFASAGHPPPLIVDADGARLLDCPPQPVLGLSPISRDDCGVELAPDATVVLYTDGLVERRGSSLDDGFAWLAAAAAPHAGASADAMADALLAEVDEAEDDVALLVLRLA